MECKFHVGQKVVCVNDTGGCFRLPGIDYWDGLDGLKKGEVYTVRAVGPSPDPFDHRVVVCLDEIVRFHKGGKEYGFHPARFRPVKDTTAEVEKLKKIARDGGVQLTPNRVTETVGSSDA